MHMHGIPPNPLIGYNVYHQNIRSGVSTISRHAHTHTYTHIIYEVCYVCRYIYIYMYTTISMSPFYSIEVVFRPLHSWKQVNILKIH